MSKFAPTRGELKLRLAISVVGLALVLAALTIHGVPTGPALFEVIGVAGVFFAGSALLSGYRLWFRTGKRED